MAKRMECPNGCNAGFYATAHVTQNWKIDAEGNFDKCVEDCIEVTHFPDYDDVWDCAKCGTRGRIVDDENEQLTSESQEPTYRVMFYITIKPGTDLGSIKKSLSTALAEEVNLEFPEIDFCSSCEIEKE